jgi:hypothetical protein
MGEAGTAGSRRLAVSALVFTSFLGAGLIAIVSAGEGGHSSKPVLSSESDVLMAGAFVGVGLFVALKRPGNLVAWALVLSGTGLLGGAVLQSYGRLALLARPDLALPAGAAMAAVGLGSWVPLMAGVFLLFLVFPSGRLSSPRARRFAVCVLSGFALVWALITIGSGRLDGPLARYDNPLALSSSTSAWYRIPTYGVIYACLGSIAAAGWMAFWRFRRSHGIERQQFKWPIAAVGLLVVTLPVAAAFNFNQEVGVLFGLELIALPIAIGIAVLRYRLYEIDRIISRTIVYGLLTVILGAAYAGLVLAGQALFSSFAGGSNLAIAISTLVVAALFMPVRSRTQAFVDRRFYRSRYDARRTLEEFSSRLREHVEIERLQSEIQNVVRQTMQPAHVSVWLRDDAAR